MEKILSGGHRKIKESGALLVGGHTVDGKELYYGLSVTGKVRPSHLVTRAGARPGDALILTQPLGTGIVATAIKGNLAEKHSEYEALEVMTMLNRLPDGLLSEAFAHAMTDVTGFGLIGHLSEMVEAENLTARLSFDSIPIISGVNDLLKLGMIPAGAYRNRDTFAQFVKITGVNEDAASVVLNDPQTSGGLLIALPENMTELMLDGLKEAGFQNSAVIGGIVDKEDPHVVVET